MRSILEVSRATIAPALRLIQEIWRAILNVFFGRENLTIETDSDWTVPIRLRYHASRGVFYELIMRCVIVIVLWLHPRYSYNTRINVEWDVPPSCETRPPAHSTHGFRMLEVS